MSNPNESGQYPVVKDPLLRSHLVATSALCMSVAALALAVAYLVKDAVTLKTLPVLALGLVAALLSVFAIFKIRKGGWR